MPRLSEPLVRRDHYTLTVMSYGAMHVTARDRHYAVLSIVTALLGPIGARTHLDRGCGTGTALAREMDRAVFRVVDPPAD